MNQVVLSRKRLFIATRKYMYDFQLIFILLYLTHQSMFFGDSISNKEIYEHAAFCRSTYTYENRNFPIDLPERHIPWIWEAVYDPIREYVDITTMNRDPCSFDINAWRELLELYPKYSQQLAYGIDSNILVPVDNNISKAELFYLNGDRVTCVFMQNTEIVHLISSFPIKGKKAFSSIGTLQIRCPTTELYNQSWNMIKLVLNPNRKQYKEQIFTNQTIAVPVCTLPHYHPHKKQYNISVCTATTRSNRSHFVEWIEYHRLLGIDHFYIYNTAISSYDNSKHNRLAKDLADYSTEGIVTIIPWPYMNCVRNMASGRWAKYKRRGEYRSFKSPRAIAQSGALASCYSRFRHTSKYIAHIDDDEFLAFHSSNVKNRFKLDNKKSDRLSMSSSISLYNLVETIFTLNPTDVAIRFEPIVYYPCHILTHHKPTIRTNGMIQKKKETITTSNNSTDNTINNILPRLGVWNTFYRSEKFECKLLMRTDIVGMFFVHFLTMVESSKFKDTSITLPRTHIAMLHYKYPASLSHNVLEGTIPFEENSFEKECSEISQLETSRELVNITKTMIERVNERYRMRMRIS